MNTEAKKGIENLVNKYNSILAQGKIKSYNEAQTRNEFIEPLFEYLGWDMRNLRNENEVLTEESTSKGRIDLAFRLNNIPVMFLEAKALKVDLDEWKWAEQAINYSWNKGVTWAVLTDFESIKVFNAEIPPKGISDNLFFEISCRDYLSKFDQLRLLSKEGFEQGLLSKEAEKWGKLAKRKQVGEKLFEDLTIWRSLLSKGFSKRNKLTQDELDEGVQRVLDRLIFIRTAEDRDIEPNILLSLLRSWESSGSRNKLYRSLSGNFRQFDDGYNSKIFALHYSEEWGIDDDVIAEVIKGLYSTKDGYRYDFSAISADVLGGIYEQYLGNVLKQAKKSASVTEAHKKRKSQGIYYTPRYIVDFIVRQTLGEALKNTKPKDISKIKVLDPACGSGSFLTAAYDEILNYYEKHSAKQTLFTKFDILKENIYGVDLDVQAVEITQLNLLLKTLSQRARLPTLQHNIRAGNSLVSMNKENLERYFGKDWLDQEPFNYHEGFSEVFRQNGFDAIIGNPPYVQLSMEGSIKKGLKEYLIDKYKSSMGRLNTFGFFIKLGIDLLREDGCLGFIIPNTVLTQDYYEELRNMILDSCVIKGIVSFEDLPFKDAVVENIVLILRKTQSTTKRNSNKVQIYHIDGLRKFIKTKSITQKLFRESHKSGFNINLKEDTLNLKEKIEKATRPLGDFLDINQAIALKHERAKYLSDKKVNSQYKPVLDGRFINRYSLKWNNTYLKYDINAIHSCKREDIFLSEEKLFFRRVGDRLIATLDNSQFYALNTLVVMNLKNKSDYDLKYFLGLFNSSLINLYYQKFLKSTKTVFSEIQARQVAQLPIKTINFANQTQKSQHDLLCNLAQQMFDLNKELAEAKENTDKWNRLKQEIDKIDHKIDEAVYKLYGLTKEEVSIIEGDKDW